MATPEDSIHDRLPPPPAPTHRSANPWPFSATARKRTSRPHAAADQPAGMQPVPASLQTAGRNLLPLVFFALAALVVLRELYETRGSEHWITLIGPLLVILLMALSWWQRRKRRNGEPGAS